MSSWRELDWHTTTCSSCLIPHKLNTIYLILGRLILKPFPHFPVSLWRELNWQMTSMFALVFLAHKPKRKKICKLTFHVFQLSYSAVQLARVDARENWIGGQCLPAPYILPTRGFHTLPWPVALCASPGAILEILELTLSWLLSLLLIVIIS